MRFWRNPEIKKQGILYSIAAVLLLTAAWFAGQKLSVDLDWTVGHALRRSLLLLTAAGLVLGAVFHFAATAMRYRKLAALAEQIDQILHGKDSMDFAGQEEGEIAILQDEVCKMTIMLREQADALKGEKQYLCDAITDLSHQLRTPLTSLNLIQTMLAKPDLTEERRVELLRQLKTLLRRIDELLVVLLKMARIDAGAVTFARERVSVAELVRQAAEPVSIPMEIKGQQLILHGEEESSYLGDFSWTIEAVGNILKNCMEHTPENGQIHVFWEENAVYTEIRMEDNGPGIAAEDLPHILERFYKGKNQGDAGFGVGLAFARMVVTGQNGVLTVENRRQGGARFVIRFYKSVV